MDPNFEKDFLGNAKNDSRSFVITTRVDRCAFATFLHFLKGQKEGQRNTDTKSSVVATALEEMADLLIRTGHGRKFNISQAIDYMEENGFEAKEQGRKGVFKDMRLRSAFEAEMDMKKRSNSLTGKPKNIVEYEMMEEKYQKRLITSWKYDAAYGEGRERSMAIECLTYLGIPIFEPGDKDYEDIEILKRKVREMQDRKIEEEGGIADPLDRIKMELEQDLEKEADRLGITVQELLDRLGPL